MAYKDLRFCKLPTLVLGLAVSTLVAQETTNRTNAQDPTDQEVRQMIRTALDEGLPTDSSDRLVVLAMRHSAIAVPLLLEHAENSRSGSTISKEVVKRIVDILAYIGDDAAIEAVIHLADSDHARFGYLVSRLLDYSWGRRNPYAVAYRVVARSHAPTLAVTMPFNTAVSNANTTR